MRRNKITDADTISVTIGKLISEARAHQLSNVNYKNIKKLRASQHRIVQTPQISMTPPI